MADTGPVRKQRGAHQVAVIGGGPAGLMAAETLSRGGAAVTLFERMPTVGRKFLMAGRGGLNLTHSEDLEFFLTRYGAARERVEPAINTFSPAALRAWCEDLGQETFVGSSGRVFPRTLKTSPLLRALLGRLDRLGVKVLTRRDWQGWDAERRLVFECGDGTRETAVPDATILALGGASWPKLGSNGAWMPLLERAGLSVSPLQSANCGFAIDWSAIFRDRFSGSPLKNIALSFAGKSGRGDAVIAGYGIEGGVVYALSATLRKALARSGPVVLTVDLRPDLSVAEIGRRLAKQRKGQSLSNRLRKGAGLTPVAINLLREGAGAPPPADPHALAGLIKALPLPVTAPQPLARAISTAGGLDFGALDQSLMVRACPGLFAAGEMLDWEAPTGGYLLQASFATGRMAAAGALAWLEREGLTLAPRDRLC